MLSEVKVKCPQGHVPRCDDITAVDVPPAGDPAGPGGGRGGFPRGIAAEHDHVDCPPDWREWLERRIGQTATMEPHPYCLVCGKVKNVDGPRARKLGFYLSGLSSLKEHLAAGARYGKMTQSQSRLITKALEELDDFEDSYGLSLEVQTRLYVEAVRRVRPDLDDDLVLRWLPRLRGRSRVPAFTRMAKAAG
jgi:hypothetical protein